MTKTQLLRKIHIFNTLSDYEIVLLAAITKKMTYPAEVTIFEENSQGNEFYIVVSGAVRISKIISELGEEALAIVREGEYFGEMALIDQSTRSATAIAHESSTLLTINRTDFKKLMYLNRNIGYKLLWGFFRTLSERVMETTDKYRGLSAMAGF
ncbi:MAG: cyclic nucleotide-binding domain-containing protein [Gemmatimonadetes bacterium]|nr:MAG: cyclic nucleotide-binding domain-containing protein [Gemmatimonadota bacterium]